MVSSEWSKDYKLSKTVLKISSDFSFQVKISERCGFMMQEVGMGNSPQLQMEVLVTFLCEHHGQKIEQA